MDHIFTLHIYSTKLHCLCNSGADPGGPRGPCPPPPNKLLPQIVRRGSRGGQEGLAPPPGGQEGLAPPPLQNPGSAYVYSGMSENPCHRIIPCEFGVLVKYLRKQCCVSLRYHRNTLTVHVTWRVLNSSADGMPDIHGAGTISQFNLGRTFTLLPAG